MIRAGFICLMFLGALLVSPSPGAAEPSTPLLPVPSLSAAPEGKLPTGALQDLLDKAVAQGIPGAVMGVATPEGSWFTASGVADEDTQEPMSPLHAMRVGNATETFTAALIWSLIEEGRLGLDDKVNRWLPSGLVPKGGVITIGMLLNHTSGLCDHTGSPEFAKKMLSDPKHRWSAQEVLEITRSHPPKFNPGTGFAYSSTDDYILGLVAQAATGQSVEKMVRNRFFAPQGMVRTALSQSGSLPRLNTPGYAWLDDRSKATDVGGWNFSGYWTAGGGTSTAYDMLAWASGLAGGTVLKPKTLRQAWKVESPSMMGYGFEVTRNALGYRRVGRTGVKPGATTDFLVYPDRGYALFIGFNSSDSRPAPTLWTRRIIREVREGAELLLGWNVENTYAKTIANGRSTMRRMLSDACAASGMIGLVDGERIVWSEAFGYIDKASKTPPSTDTLFAIGSTSKLFAGMATMKLVEEGKIDLDAPLVQYLPGFHMVSPEYSQITVRMLLNHSAGFPGGDYRGDSTYEPKPDFAAQVQQTLTTQRLKYTPGEMATYCNDCFTMIDPLVAAVSGGKTYAEFVQDEILTPLGMTHTRFAAEPFPAGSYAPYYACKADYSGTVNVPDPQIYTNTYPAGGLYTSANDMARVAMMLMNGGRYGKTRVLSEASVAEIGRDQTLRLPVNPVPTESYGLGWDWVTYPGLAAVGVRAWAKPGGAAGYATQFIVAPDEGLAVIVTGVALGFDPGQVAEQVLLHALAERGSIPGVPQPMPEVKQPEKPGTEAVLASIVGDYAESYKLHRVKAMPNGTLKITTYMGVNGVFTRLTPVARLKWRADGTFSSDDAPNVSYRALSAGGRRYLAMNQPYYMQHYRLESIIGERIKSGTPLSAAWRKRVGLRWLVVNDDAQSVWLARGTPRFTLYALNGFPGYVFAAGQPMLAPSDIVDPSRSDMLARMFLKIPMAAGRDLNDVVILNRNGGEEWVRYGSTVYRPQDSVLALLTGSSEVAIGPEGYAEWRQLPIAGSVAITGADAWKLYDADLKLKASGTGDGNVKVETRDSYLMLYGAPGTSIALMVNAS